MPADLREAHERNDEVLERIYIGRRFRNDTERLEKLFELYTKMTAIEGAQARHCIRKQPVKRAPECLNSSGTPKRTLSNLAEAWHFSFEEASTIFDGPVFSRSTTRSPVAKSYESGATVSSAGLIGSLRHHTDRDEVTRIISARKANQERTRHCSMPISKQRAG